MLNQNAIVVLNTIITYEGYCTVYEMEQTTLPQKATPATLIQHNQNYQPVLQPSAASKNPPAPLPNSFQTFYASIYPEYAQLLHHTEILNVTTAR